jgi:hypothetical protein
MDSDLARSFPSNFPSGRKSRGKVAFCVRNQRPAARAPNRRQADRVTRMLAGLGVRVGGLVIASLQ